MRSCAPVDDNESRLPPLADLITTAAATEDPDLVAESLQLRSAALLELGDSRASAS